MEGLIPYIIHVMRKQKCHVHTIEQRPDDDIRWLKPSAIGIRSFLRIDRSDFQPLIISEHLSPTAAPTSQQPPQLID